MVLTTIVFVLSMIPVGSDIVRPLSVFRVRDLRYIRYASSTNSAWRMQSAAMVYGP